MRVLGKKLKILKLYCSRGDLSVEAPLTPKVCRLGLDFVHDLLLGEYWGVIRGDMLFIQYPCQL